MDFIPQIEPWIDHEELEQLTRVVDSTYVTEHKLTEEFEDLIKKLTGSTYAVSITNGTAALYCCLKALGIGEGDEVIVPNLTFIATSNAVIMAGATPVFCEVEPSTLCINPECVWHLVTPRTKAIMPVHLYGQACKIDDIVDIANKFDLRVIEDAAQGVGVKFNDQHVGTFGEMGILSFYGNKTLTCGEGGIVLTDNKKLRDEVYRLKNHGRLTKGVFKHDSIGFNFSFTEMQAAIGISQLNKLERIINKKNQIREKYIKDLSPISSTLRPIHPLPNCSPVWWFTSFLTERKKDLQEYLKQKNIQTRDFFTPLHQQPCYSYAGTPFSISEKLYQEGISLPSAYNLNLKQQDYIISEILTFHDSIS